MPDAKAPASGAAAKAQAKPKAKAKVASQERPRPWRTSSATGAQSEAVGGLRLDPKRANDEIHKLEAYCYVARHFGDKDVLQTMELNRRKALRAKADKLPPTQRVEHLQRRHREAKEELRKLIVAQEALDDQIRQLQARSREQYEAVEDQRAVVENIREAFERAEMDVPPKAAPKAVGRQVQPGDPGELLQTMSVSDILKAVKVRIFAAAGGTV